MNTKSNTHLLTNIKISFYSPTSWKAKLIALRKAVIVSFDHHQHKEHYLSVQQVLDEPPHFPQMTRVVILNDSVNGFIPASITWNIQWWGQCPYPFIEWIPLQPCFVFSPYLLSGFDYVSVHKVSLVTCSLEECIAISFTSSGHTYLPTQLIDSNTPSGTVITGSRSSQIVPHFACYWNVSPLEMPAVLVGAAQSTDIHMCPLWHLYRVWERYCLKAI